MTEQTQPTDAELLAEYDRVFNATRTIDRHGVALRAVLAKLGTPAGAGEPFGYFHQLLNHEGNGNGVWLGAAERKVVEQAHVPGETSEEIVTLYTTPQPTQAQAGAVPLAQYRVLEPGVDRIEADDEYLQDDAQTWAIDPNGTFVGTLYGYALRAARRRIAKKEGADHA